MPDSTPETPRKQCKTCGEDFPQDTVYFYRSSTSKDGLEAVCKTCRNNRQKTRDPEKRKESQARYRAKNTDRIREQFDARRDFYRANFRNWYDQNRDVMNKQRRHRYVTNPQPKKEAAKAWYQAHRDQIHETQRRYYERNRTALMNYVVTWRQKNRVLADSYNRTWLAKNPGLLAIYRANRRARKKALPDTMTRDDVALMLKYWHGRCAITGEPGKLHIDHWIPLNSPDCPGTVPTNLIPVLDSLNLSKGDRNPHAWLIKKFGEEQAAIIEARIMGYFDWLRTRGPS